MMTAQFAYELDAENYRMLRAQQERVEYLRSTPMEDRLQHQRERLAWLKAELARLSVPVT